MPPLAHTRIAWANGGGSGRIATGSAHLGPHVQAPWTTHRLGHSSKSGWNRINYEFDDSQIDAHGFATFRSHNLTCLPSFSTDFPPNELILINGLGGSVIVEHEWPVFNLKRYWKIRALRNGILKLAICDEAPRAGLGKGGHAKR